MTRSIFGPLVVLVFVSSTALTLARPAVRNTLKLPATPYRYASVELPQHFTQAGRNHDNTPPENPLTDEGATLGRVLFYDTRLSKNNTTSCASCHVQAHAFADPRRFSKGFHDALTDRRAMPLVNVRYYQRARFFWDERAGNLEEMVLLPLQSRIEMGQDLKQVVDVLTRDATYRALFTRAFGDREITEQRIGRALAQFVRSMVSYQSRYDEGRAGTLSARDDFDNFSLQENRGKALFIRNCSNCHMKDGNEHFFVPTPANTGLRGNHPSADGGVGDATLRQADLGSFKSPSLRNVEVTAPYGHDGRFATLDALIEHYSDNPIFDPNLGYMMPVGPLRFTASEKAALIAFLKTLTDRAFLTDPRFSNPFVDTTDAARRVQATLTARGKSMAVAAHDTLEVLPALLVREVPPPLPPAPRGDSNPEILRRLVSFDANKDDRVSRDEMPERMQALIAQGDSNADGALDSYEMRALLKSGSRPRTQVPAHPQLSEGLPGVVSDLKLAPATEARAAAIVSAHKMSRHSNEPASCELYGEMKALLDSEEYEDFLAAAARLPKAPQNGTGVVCKVLQAAVKPSPAR